MRSVTDLLRKIAEEIKTPEKFKSHEVRVFFSAPGLNSLKTKRDPSLSESANFQWTALWLYFFKGEKYYIYRLTLTPDGKKGIMYSMPVSFFTIGS